jgi:signal transduction histidine kinase/CheY-like chemotaxis protein
VDNITVGVVLLNTNSEILEMNQQMRNWYPDISIEDSPRCFDVMDCCCKDAPWTGTCPVYQTITDGQIHKAIHRDKDITYQLLSSPLPDEEGKIASVVLIKENITQRLISEKELRQAQKMEALGTLAGGIAHDFNNILTAILGFSSLIKSGASPESELYDDASEIERAAYRASDLVKQILTFSRQKETELKKIRIDIIIKEALKLLRSTIPTTIDIRTDIQRTQDVILADPTQIHQIIMNLCTNAAHAMEKRGGVLSVSLSTENLTSLADPGLSTEQFVNYLKLVVKDTGHGIPEDTIDSIFDPYFTTKNLGEGTGLGLSVVQGIVETIGGRISVRSEPGLGTEFTIIFPIADRAGSPDRDGGGPGIEGGSENILLIDDEPGVLKVGRRILKSLGYHVTTENDSERAMETIHRNPQRFDLIITDTTMPKIDGIALARMAMKARPDLPVIICTGYSKRISAEKCREMGIRALIQKPLSVAGIASEIRKIFDQGKK